MDGASTALLDEVLPKAHAARLDETPARHFIPPSIRTHEMGLRTSRPGKLQTPASSCCSFSLLLAGWSRIHGTLWDRHPAAFIDAQGQVIDPLGRRSLVHSEGQSTSLPW